MKKNITIAFILLFFEWVILGYAYAEPFIVIESPETLITTESGGTTSFTVRLSEAIEEDVIVSMASSDIQEGTVSPMSLRFTPTNWHEEQSVTITGVNDDNYDGHKQYFIGFSASSDIAVMNILPVTNKDDDIFIVSEIDNDTTEDGTTASFSVRLIIPPTELVNIEIKTSDATEGRVVSPISLQFTPGYWDDIEQSYVSGNWNIDQSVKIEGVDDNIIDGPQDYHIELEASSEDTNYDGIIITVPVINYDDDYGVIIGQISNNTSEDGTAASFAVRLSTDPGMTSTINMRSSNLNEGTVSPSNLNFTVKNWNNDQTVIVTGVNDDIDDGNQPYHIIVDPIIAFDSIYSGLNPDDVSVINEDDDEAGFIVSDISGNTTENGGEAVFTVRLNSEPVRNISIGVISDNTSEGTVSTSNLTFTADNWNEDREVRVTGRNDNIDDGNQPYTILLSEAVSSIDPENGERDNNYHGLNPNDVSVINENDDEAGFIFSLIINNSIEDTIAPINIDTPECGGIAQFVLRLTSQPLSDVTINITSSNENEGIIDIIDTTSPDENGCRELDSGLIFDENNWNSVQCVIRIKSVNDYIVDGDQEFSVELEPASSNDINYNGLDPEDISVNNRDDDIIEPVFLPVDSRRMQMISFFHYPENPSPTSIFGEQVRENYQYSMLYKIGTYDPQINGYREYGEEMSAIEPGKAYWCYARDGLDISFNGIPVCMNEDFDINLSYDSATGDGWNMIACPYETAYNWNDVQVLEYDNNHNVIHSIPISQLPSGYIYWRLLWRWRNGTYVYYQPAGETDYNNPLYERDTDSDAGMINPNVGYWVRAERENIALRFPSVNSGTIVTVNATHQKRNNWIKKWLHREAIASSNDSPPLPPGGNNYITIQDNSSSAESGGGGCFINTSSVGLSKENR